MIVRVSSQLYITLTGESPRDFEKWLDTNFTMPNPAYNQALRFSSWGVPKGIPKRIIMWAKRGNEYVLPFGGWRLLRHKFSEAIKWEREFYPLAPVDYKSKQILYDYQEEACTAMLEAQSGILCSPTSSGKTNIMIEVAARLGCRTLFVSHTKDLLKQCKERAESVLGCDRKYFGTITDGAIKASEGMTFATIQTLAKIDLSEYKYFWGCVISDETHRVAGSYNNLTMYMNVLNRLAAPHRYGMTATLKRTDGMEFCTERIIGPVMHTVSDGAVASKKAPVEVSLLSVPNSIELKQIVGSDGTVNHASLQKAIAEDDIRNKAISEKLKNLLTL